MKKKNKSLLMERKVKTKQQVERTVNTRYFCYQRVAKWQSLYKELHQ